MSEQVTKNDNAAFIFGQKAEAVLNNEAFTFAITAMKGEIVAKLTTDSITGDNTGMIELVRKLQCITELEDELKSIMQAGQFSERDMLAKSNNKQRNKR